jgi:hypothetical protein
MFVDNGGCSREDYNCRSIQGANGDGGIVN